MKQRIALIGFGTVGQGLAEILFNKRQELKSRYDYDFEIVAVNDLAWGAVYHPDGLDIKRLLTEVKEKNRFLSDLKDWDALTMIRDSNANVICELAYTDLKTGEPAISHCQTAFGLGKHIVTSNKGLSKPEKFSRPEWGDVFD